MKHFETSRVVPTYVKGFAWLFAQAVTLSLLILWGLQALALVFDETYDWGAIFVHLVLSVYFLMLFPGQRIWTLQIAGADGQTYTIVGTPKQDSEA